MKYDNPHNIRKGLYHVIADSLPELEAFAAEMSISPTWISPGKGLIPACLDITSEELPAAILGRNVFPIDWFSEFFEFFHSLCELPVRFLAGEYPAPHRDALNLFPTSGFDSVEHHFKRNL